MTIAGHTFVEAPQGRICPGCGKMWTDIAGVTRADIHTKEWAHEGNLTEAEYDQIVAERERLWATVASVVTG